MCPTHATGAATEGSRGLGPMVRLPHEGAPAPEIAVSLSSSCRTAGSGGGGRGSEAGAALCGDGPAPVRSPSGARETPVGGTDGPDRPHDRARLSDRPPDRPTTRLTDCPTARPASAPGRPDPAGDMGAGPASDGELAAPSTRCRRRRRCGGARRVGLPTRRHRSVGSANSRRSPPDPVGNSRRILFGSFPAAARADAQQHALFRREVQGAASRPSPGRPLRRGPRLNVPRPDVVTSAL